MVRYTKIFLTYRELELNMLENVHVVRPSIRIRPVFVSDIENLCIED
jgi:hypothetical protein